MDQAALLELPACVSRTSPRDCDAEHLASQIRRQLRGRMWDFQVTLTDDGLVLLGRAPSYYVKQIVQHAVMAVSCVPIAANRIEVTDRICRRSR